MQISCNTSTINACGFLIALCQLQPLLIKLPLADFCIKKEQYDEVKVEVENLLTQIPNTDKLLAIQGVGIATVVGFLTLQSRFKSSMDFPFGITEAHGKKLNTL